MTEMPWEAMRLPFRVDYDFDDERANAILGIDVDREVCLAVVRVWGKPYSKEGREDRTSEMRAVMPGASQVSRREVDYPAIREIHASTSLVMKPSDSQPEMLRHLGIKLGVGVHIPVPGKWPEVLNYVEAVGKRRSKRNFVRKEMEGGCLGALLILLGDEYGKAETPYPDSICLGLLSGKIKGIEPAFYLIDRGGRSLRRVSPGHFLEKMAHICLDQEWLGHAALHFLFLTNFELLERTWGPRGYRYAMLTAGRLGHRIYLGATALGIGCCGIGAFYDREAAQLLGLNEPSSLLYLVAAGPVKN
jgi:SagB-type dehydrogenase family enzyme